MEQNRYASSAEACNLLLGLLIVAQFPIMFGAAGPNAVIQMITWGITAYPMIIITVVLMYRSGDIVGATSNAVLSVVLMGQNFVKGIMNLVYFVSGKEVPAELQGAVYGRRQLVF